MRTSGGSSHCRHQPPSPPPSCSRSLMGRGRIGGSSRRARMRCDGGRAAGSSAQVAWVSADMPHHAPSGRGLEDRHAHPALRREAPHPLAPEPRPRTPCPNVYWVVGSAPCTPSTLRMRTATRRPSRSTIRGASPVRAPADGPQGTRSIAPLSGVKHACSSSSSSGGGHSASARWTVLTVAASTGAGAPLMDQDTGMVPACSPVPWTCPGMDGDVRMRAHVRRCPSPAAPRWCAWGGDRCWQTCATPRSRCTRRP